MNLACLKLGSAGDVQLHFLQHDEQASCDRRHRHSAAVLRLFGTCLAVSLSLSRSHNPNRSKSSCRLVSLARRNSEPDKGLGEAEDPRSLSAACFRLCLSDSDGGARVAALEPGHERAVSGWIKSRCIRRVAQRRAMRSDS